VTEANKEEVMQTYSRRQLFQFAAGAAVAAGTGQLFGKATAGVPEEASKKALRLGLLVRVSDDPEKVMAHVHGLGLPTAHVMIWDFSPATAARLRGALDRYEVEATVLYSSGPGEEKYDLVDGPPGFGLIPSRYRRQRIDQLKRASDFAKRVGVPALFNQWGFIPEVPSDPLYEPTVEAVREIAGHCKGNGQMFFNETGQETPITLLRTIQDAGTDNLGLVLDAANLVLYGKGNPVDALDVIGSYVRAIHVKGGFYPTDPKHLGRQVPASQSSKVDWPRIFQRLKELGYDGTATIEAGNPETGRDQEILGDKAYLEGLIAQG
jgi:L-ribulose-5-phosphate 3-epimerase